MERVTGQLTVMQQRVCKELGFYNNEGEYLLEEGLFRFYVGGNSADCLMEEV